ncbi:hypothetical protein A6F68_00334 [Tsuneonella dongtanensis]|uniref:Uncharacterized protein n=1 Tax=Tsuneonella dongtanensis TaxID=692370 RepID=A0A1B2A9N5_9SPHN|nr:hypothetical protein [Tsuneonella dongtanensis]ANY18869.1 hypothetical protein A6F68_00334 [Tsuneonella dongtanensis]
MTEKPRRKTAAKVPVSAHPAFPAIVALWFAALLGIGSLVLPVTLFERLSEASGLSSVFLAAQAPLGLTARMAIAGAAAVVGVFIGLALAGRVVAANAPRTTPRRVAAIVPTARAQDDGAKRPISAHEELGLDGIDNGDDDDAPIRDSIPGRRRALSVTDDSARSEYLESVPLPGHASDEPLPIAGEFDAEEAGQDEAATDTDVEPLDLGDFNPADEASPDDRQTGDESGARRFDDPRRFEMFGTTSLNSPPVSQSSFAPSMRFESPVDVAKTQAPSDVRKEIEMAEFAPQQLGQDPEHSGPGDSSPVAAEPAIVDLVERFARALQRRRQEIRDDVADDVTAEGESVIDLTFALAPKSAGPVASEPAVTTLAPDRPFDGAPAPVIPSIPAALRPFGFDDDAIGAEDDEDDDGIPSLELSLSLSQSARPFAPPPAAGPVAEDDEDEAASEPVDEGYSSLLAMKSPFGLPREAARVEDDPEELDAAIEPVVVFPGQATRRAMPAADGPARDATPASIRPFDAPADRVAVSSASPRSAAPANPGETERALREALEKLQRMSGAA